MILWAFLNPDSEASFSSSGEVLKVVKRRFPKTTIHDVEDVLQRIPTYTLHKGRRIRFERLRTKPAGFMEDVQVDLADFQKVADHNDGYHYMLVGVDVLSRRVFAAPVKSKASGHMITAFKALLKQMPANPRRIFSDKGLEFLARPVKLFLTKIPIQQLTAESPDVKASVAERFIRTIKGRLYRYFTQNQTKRWVDVIPKIIDAINRTKSRATGMRPIDVDFYNAQEVRDKVYGPNPISPPKTPSALYEKGDKVRISKAKKTFEKSYLPNYTKEVFEIDAVNRDRPQTYRIKDTKGESITGHFYDQELSKTKYERDRKLKIRAVLKQRKRRGLQEHLVAFEGRPDDEAVWITEADLV